MRTEQEITYCNGSVVESEGEENVLRFVYVTEEIDQEIVNNGIFWYHAQHPVHRSNATLLLHWVGLLWID